jgi:hypothetical protein
MNSKKYLILIALIFLVSCTTMPQDRSASISRALVGQWEWERPSLIGDCSYLENIAFRANGTLTSTSESCDFADDGFGLFSYGWYVANETICFTEDSRQYEDEIKRNAEYKLHFMSQVKEGYVAERCHWKVKRITTKSIDIEIDSTDNQENFTMFRRRWL